MLNRAGALAVALSGGVDSSFLLAAAHHHLAGRVLALTIITPYTLPEEYIAASRLTASLRIRHHILPVAGLIPGSLDTNPIDRCYLCKHTLMSICRATATAAGFHLLADGSNRDDSPAERPGCQALAELGISSPLREAGLGKREIRQLSHAIGLPTWDKPSQSCLLTRFPHGETITQDKLNQVALCEKYVRNQGCSVVRVRCTGNKARVELDEAGQGILKKNPAVWAAIEAFFPTAGFTSVTLETDPLIRF